MSDWTGMITVARIEDGRAVWETLSQAESRAPIESVRVTTRQAAILAFLARWHREHSGMPSYAEIAAAVGMVARSGVQYQLDQLVAKGLVERGRGRYGAIRLNVVVRPSSSASNSVT